MALAPAPTMWSPSHFISKCLPRGSPSVSPAHGRIKELKHDNATLDARVVTRAIEIGEIRAALEESEAERLRLQQLVARG